jgi:hypothetical protein
MFFEFTLRALTKGSLQQQFYLDTRELESTLERPKPSLKARCRSAEEDGTPICSRPSIARETVYTDYSSARSRPFRSLNRIADVQTENQAGGCNKNQGDESKASCERLGSIVEEADYFAALIHRRISSDSRLDFVPHGTKSFKTNACKAGTCRKSWQRWQRMLNNSIQRSNVLLPVGN